MNPPTFRAAAPADWAAKAQEAASVSAALAWVEMGDLALVVSLNESFLLQPLAVNLINAHGAADEVPIFLIRKSASARGPGKLTGRFRMIGVVNDIPLNSRIWRNRFSFIDQNRMIDAETRICSEKADEQLATRQGCIEIGVSFVLVVGIGVMPEQYPGIAEPKITRPTKADVCPHDFGPVLTHFAQIGITQKHHTPIFR